MTKFDQFASRYKSVLDRSLALSGEDSGYFTEYKAAYVLKQLRGNAPAPRILDFGCGTGTLSAALAGRRPDLRIDGFDVSSESLARVDIGLRSRGLFSNRTGDLRNDYDLIVLSNVLHHVPIAHRAGTIGDLASRLVAGGVLLVFEHNPLNPLTRWVVAHCEFDDDAQLLWPGEVRRYFAAAGLGAMRRDYIVFFPKVLAPLRRAEPLLGWCPAGAQYATSARRPSSPTRTAP